MATHRLPGPQCAVNRPANVQNGQSPVGTQAPPGPLAASAPSTQPVGLEIVSPATCTALSIDTAGPTMPHIHVKAQLTGIFPDPTATTTFRWTAQVRFDSVNCPHGGSAAHSMKSDSELLTGTCVGGEFDLAFATVSGGELVVEVSADVAGRTLTGKTQQVRIQGTNPTSDQIKALISAPIVGRIIRHESSLLQFIATPGEENATYPHFSADNLFGVGLSQLTPCTVPTMWNWRKNVEAANDKFKSSMRISGAFAARCRSNANFIRLVNKWNSERVAAHLPALPVTLPDLTAEQIEHDAVRCYNGASGRDLLLGAALHEYRVVLIDVNNLAIQVDPSGTTASASWEVSPISARTSGEPDYVNSVYRSAEL